MKLRASLSIAATVGFLTLLGMGGTVLVVTSAQDRPVLRWEVPEGYRGLVAVDWEVPGCSELRDGATLVLAVGRDGHGCTSASPPPLNAEISEMFYVTSDGSRQAISLSREAMEISNRLFADRQEYYAFPRSQWRLGITPMDQGQTWERGRSPLPRAPLELAVISQTGYPFVVSSVSAPERDERRAMFIDRNGAGWNVTIDPFGYAEVACLVDESLVDQTLTSTPEGQAALLSDVELAWFATFLRTNADLYGIGDSETFMLAPNERRSSTGAILSRSGQAQQRFASEPVDWPESVWWNRSINVVKFRLGSGPFEIESRGQPVNVCVFGHFWPQANVPNTPRIAVEAIVASLTGQPFGYFEALPRSGSAPMQHAAREARIVADQIEVNTRPRWWLASGGHLQLRLVHQVRLTRSGNFSWLPDEWLIDAITGEELSDVTAWPASVSGITVP